MGSVREERSRQMSNTLTKTMNNGRAARSAERFDDTADKSVSVQYIHHPLFDDPEAVHEILESIVDTVPNSDGGRISSADYLLPTRPLLSKETEEALFLRMNLLKCLAARHLARGGSKTDVSVQGLLREADELRRYIVEANQRLVVKMSSKYRNQGIPFEDLISEGNLSLMKATGLFNVGRGFRFSTYATYSILRTLSRFVKREQKRQFAPAETDPVIEEGFPEWLDISPAEIATDVLSQLAPRDRRIIRDRFGFNQSGKASTLREISEEVGLSKERVRQLITRACESARRKYGSVLGIDHENEKAAVTAVTGF